MTPTINNIVQPENWEITSPAERMFTSDHVIDAYLKGQSDALEREEMLIMEKLVANINTAASHTKEILAFMSDHKFNPIGNYLRINSWDDFTMLLVLPESEFLDDKINDLYGFISNLEDSVCSDFYKLNISICDTEEGVDDTMIKSDGFNLKYRS